MGLSIIRRDIAPGKRILVTSDIHGHIDHLKNVLDMAHFCDSDLLVIVGDVVEKGPHSLETLRYVMSLYEKGNVEVTMGNVDLWRLWMIDGISEDSVGDFFGYLLSQREWKGTNFYDEMAAECGVSLDSPEDILRTKDAICSRFKPELDFLRSRPTALETQNYIFVHGGMTQKNFENADTLDPYGFLKYDSFMSCELCFDKYIVVGHWPVTLYSEKIPQSNPVINRQKKIISIDGGCGLKKDGQLNLIEIPDVNCDESEIKHYSYDGLPVCTALEDQEASADSLYIKWTDNEINELETEDGFTYAEHVSTGKRLWICSDYIYREHHCDDFTDYALPVKKGDRLSVVKVTSRGIIAKKDGVTGWYYGKIKE